MREREQARERKHTENSVLVRELARERASERDRARDRLTVMLCGITFSDKKRHGNVM